LNFGKRECPFTALKEHVQRIVFVLIPSTSVVGNDGLSEIATKNPSEFVEAALEGSTGPQTFDVSFEPGDRLLVIAEFEVDESLACPDHECSVLLNSGIVTHRGTQ
jgi:hypothetical protein